MSKNAWLTPAETTETRQCWRVFVPDSEKMEAAFRGALHLLSIPENWEKFGAATPEDTAEMWMDANAQTFGMTECMEEPMTLPAGIITAYGGWPLPDRFLPCDGNNYDPVDYPELFAIIGFRFGETSGNFNVPNMHERYVKYINHGQTMWPHGGNAETTLIEANLPEHNHSIPGAATAEVVSAAGIDVKTPSTPGDTGNTGSGTSFSNEPPFQRLWAVITTGKP